MHTVERDWWKGQCKAAIAGQCEAQCEAQYEAQRRTRRAVYTAVTGAIKGQVDSEGAMENIVFWTRGNNSVTELSSFSSFY